MFASGGSRISRGGGVDSRGGYVPKMLYVKTKESGPLGGCAPGTPPLDPPMFALLPCLRLEMTMFVEF